MTRRQAPTIVYLVRHGETEWNAEGRCQGRADADFTEAGRQQLRSLAAELADVTPAAAYTSPLPRAVRTAAAILEGVDFARDASTIYQRSRMAACRERASRIGRHRCMRRGGVIRGRSLF